jgi:hypothetical protein
VTEDRGAAWRRRYGKPLRPDVIDAQLTEDVDPHLDRSELRERLRAVFAADPRVDRGTRVASAVMV